MERVSLYPFNVKISDADSVNITEAFFVETTWLLGLSSQDIELNLSQFLEDGPDF